MSTADDIQRSNKRQSDFYRAREGEEWTCCPELTEEEQDDLDYEEERASGKIWCGADKVESHLS